MTIDKLLLKIINNSSKPLEELISNRDYNVLKTLATNISSHLFITENQGRLVVKILRENSEKLTEFKEEILQKINEPTWSKPFRHIPQVKKFFLSKNSEQEPVLTVEFTFSAEIRKILSDLFSKTENLSTLQGGKLWYADYTEKNIVALYEALYPLKFEIEDTIKNHYLTIKSWSKIEVENQFVLTNIENKNFHKAITNDLGIATPIDQNIINDRSMRYKYITENPRNFGENLTEIIANRSNTKIFIDKDQYDLSDVVASLIKLHRMPMLVVFDNTDEKKFVENLEILKISLEKNGIFDNVGIYFRLPNSETGKKFNTIISENKYNFPLEDATIVASVLSGKIPKFFLKNRWQPMSVIALDTKMGLRHGKTSVYTNCCDLIIEYSDEASILSNRKILV